MVAYFYDSYWTNVPDKVMMDDAEIVRANYTTLGGIVHTMDKVSYCYICLAISLFTQEFILKIVQTIWTFHDVRDF